MPNPNQNQQQHKDPQIERFVQDHPEYKPFFETYPAPQSQIRENPYYNRYVDFLKEQEPVLKDKAELTYMGNILNDALQKKYPKEYQQINDQYGYNPEKPSNPQTRIKGANAFSKQNPSFYLNQEEQQKVLGSNFDRYVYLRNKYGKDLNLIGEGDDPNKPESWKVGARHAVAFYPTPSTLEVSPKEQNQQIKDKATFSRYEQYSTEKGFTGYTKFSNIDPDNPQENVSNIPVRQLKKVDFIHDPSDRVNTPEGVVFKNPGFHFYKYYDDGTKEEITENAYQTLKMFNKLPSYLKSKYTYDIPKE